MLHRRFLVLAMQKQSATPFQHSVVQVGHTAGCIVNATWRMYRRHPDFVSREPTFWSISFSAAVCLVFFWVLPLSIKLFI